MTRRFALVDADTVCLAPIRVAVVSAGTAAEARRILPGRRVIAFPLPAVECSVGGAAAMSRADWRELPVLTAAEIAEVVADVSFGLTERGAS